MKIPDRFQPMHNSLTGDILNRNIVAYSIFNKSKNNDIECPLKTLFMLVLVVPTVAVCSAIDLCFWAIRTILIYPAFSRGLKHLTDLVSILVLPALTLGFAFLGQVPEGIRFQDSEEMEALLAREATANGVQDRDPYDTPLTCALKHDSISMINFLLGQDGFGASPDIFVNPISLMEARNAFGRGTEQNYMLRALITALKKKNLDLDSPLNGPVYARWAVSGMTRWSFIVMNIPESAFNSLAELRKHQDPSLDRVITLLDRIDAIPFQSSGNPSSTSYDDYFNNRSYQDKIENIIKEMRYSDTQSNPYFLALHPESLAWKNLGVKSYRDMLRKWIHYNNLSTA